MATISEECRKVYLTATELTEQGFNEWWKSFLRQRYNGEGGITYEVKSACYVAWHTAVNHHKRING